MTTNNINKFGPAQVIYAEDGTVAGIYDPELEITIPITNTGGGDPGGGGTTPNPNIFVKNVEGVVTGLVNPADGAEIVLPVTGSNPDIFIKDGAGNVTAIKNPATNEQVALAGTGVTPSPNIFVKDVNGNVTGILNPSSGEEVPYLTLLNINTFVKDAAGNVTGLYNPATGETVPFTTQTPDVGIDTFETVVQPETFDVPTRSYSDRLYIDGKIFKKINSGNTPDMFMYAIERATTFSADNLVLTGLNNSSTAMKKIGSIKVPADALRWSSLSKITFTVTANANLSNCTMYIGNSAIRTGVNHLVEKLIPVGFGANTATFELGLEPLEATKVKLSEFSVETGATKYPFAESMMWDMNTLANVEFPIHFKFNGSAVVPATVTINAVTAQIDILPPPQFQYNPALTYRKSGDQPFPSDDPFNVPITDRVVVRQPIYAVDFASTGSTTTGTINASGSAGSDLVTVPDTTKIKVGMYPVISGVYGTADVDTNPGTYSTLYGLKTQDTFGSNNDVIQIVSATQIRMRNPLILALSERGKEAWGEIHGLVFYESTETVSCRLGVGNNSMRIGLFSGVIKTSTKSIGWQDRFPVMRAAPTDPVRRWNINQLNSPNGWIFTTGTDTTITAGGELYNHPIWMKTPPILTTAYLTQKGNADRNLVIISDCGKYAIEMIYATFDPATNIGSCVRAVVIDLTGPSNMTVYNRPEYANSGYSQGTRAWGGGLLNGMIRKHELDKCTDTGNIAADIAKAMNAIPHALAMVLSSAQLKSHNYCPDFNVQATKITMKGYRNQLDKWKPGIKSGGTGYAEGDVLWAVGGTGMAKLTLAVTAVNGIGVITDWFVTQTGQYITLPADGDNITTTTSGSGTGAIISVTNIPGDATQDTLAEAFPNLGVPQMYVYPASVCDNGWSTEYSGTVPMGAMFTIDPNWDLAAEWTNRRTNAPAALSSSYELLAVFAAVQRYGAFNLDITRDTHLVVVGDRDITDAQWQKITGDTGSFTMPSVVNLKNRLLYVENVTPQGKGPGGNYVVPLSPPLYPMAN